MLGGQLHWKGVEASWAESSNWEAPLRCWPSRTLWPHCLPGMCLPLWARHPGCPHWTKIVLGTLGSLLLLMSWKLQSIHSLFNEVLLCVRLCLWRSDTEVNKTDKVPVPLPNSFVFRNIPCYFLLCSVQCGRGWGAYTCRVNFSDSLASWFLSGFGQWEANGGRQKDRGKGEATVFLPLLPVSGGISGCRYVPSVAPAPTG